MGPNKAGRTAGGSNREEVTPSVCYGRAEGMDEGTKTRLWEKETRQLTLTIGWQGRHGSILHHTRRTGTSHHGGIGTSCERSALASHGERLRVIHHLVRLV
jgi:hypothetical protein